MEAAYFKNQELEDHINEHGYAVIEGFLTEDEVAFLKSYYEGLHSVETPGMNMWNSLWDVPEHQREEVSETILKVLKPNMAKHFNNWKCPVGTFMSKCEGEHSVCGPHRDYSILDENQYQYRNCWVPLVDITMDNGTLYVFPGSHKVFTNILPMFNKWPYEEYIPDMMRFAKHALVKAGDLVVYRDKTLHGSYANQSDAKRPVVHWGALPKNAVLSYFHRDRENPDSEVEMFEVPEDFYFKHDFMKKPEGFPLVKTFKVEDPAYTKKEFLHLFREDLADGLMVKEDKGMAVETSATILSDESASTDLAVETITTPSKAWFAKLLSWWKN